MQRRGQGVHDTLKALLDSNLNGQLRIGDSIAVWTFNEGISTNFFPAQSWSVSARASLGARLPDFLEASMYEKRASLDRLMTRLNAEIANADLLTLVLITSADDDIVGTPFDAQIKRTFAQWRGEAQRGRMPMLTLLRGSHGRFLQWSVTAAPWPLEIPPLETAVLAPKSKPADSVGTNLTASNRPLNRPITAPATNAPAPLVGANTNAPASEVKMTNSPPAEIRTQAVQIEITSIVTNTVGSATVPMTNARLSAAASQSAGNPEATNAVAPAPVASPTAQPTNDTRLASAASTDIMPKIGFTADPPRREDGTLASIHNADVPPGPAPPAAAARTNPTTAPETASQGDPPNSPQLATQDLSAASSSANLIPPVDEKPAARIAIATPMNRSFLRENTKWIVGACLAGIVCIFCVLLWLSSYTRNQVSLATFSKEKREK